MKILFMGTPDFAVPVLEALIAAGHEVVLAVTQPDKAAGRSKALVPPPVKVCAQAHGIPVFQPERVRRPEAMAELGKVEADLGVVVAFGQILPQALLDLPSHGCFNVHASLLPMYRGASPINHVILAGEKESGVTIMQMDAGIDTGDILLQEAVPIEEDETAETLAEKLSALGARLIVRFGDVRHHLGRVAAGHGERRDALADHTAGGNDRTAGERPSSLARDVYFPGGKETDRRRSEGAGAGGPAQPDPGRRPESG